MRGSDDALLKQALSTAKQRSTGWYRVCCPYCVDRVGKADTTYAGSYNPSHGGYTCFRCGKKGHDNRDRGELELIGSQITDQPPAPGEWQRPPDGYKELSALPDDAFQSARRYLDTRHMRPAIQREARIGATLRGQYGQRVVVPVLGDDGESWYGWCARTWLPKVDKRFKYRFPPGMPRGRVLYNHAALWEKTDEIMYVVEGAFDALAHWPHAVAVFGKPTEHQIHALSRSKRPLCVVLDGDAHEEGTALALRLQFEGARAGSVRLPAGFDPDEVPADWLFEEARRSL